MDWLFKNLFDYETPDSRGRRIHWVAIELFAVVFTLIYVWEWGIYLDDILDVVLPLGIAQFIDISFMFKPYVGVVNAILITVFILVGFARKWRPAYFVVFVLFHFQYAARYCLGEISHGSNFIGLTIFSLALGAIFFKDTFLRRRFSLGMIFFFFGLGYVTSALSKLIGTGITWPDGHHLWLWIAERSVDTTSKFGESPLSAWQEFVAGSRFVATIVLTIGLVTEALGFMIWFKKTRYWVMPIIVMMHIGIAFTMSIFFEAYTYQILILGIPWYILIDRYFESSKDVTHS